MSRSMYSWAEMRRWCPQLGHTFSARTNRSLMSMCPHSSHFSQASAGISSFTRSELRGLRSFLNQAIRAIGIGLDGDNLGTATGGRQPRLHNSLLRLRVARLARLARHPQGDAHGE